MTPENYAKIQNNQKTAMANLPKETADILSDTLEKTRQMTISCSVKDRGEFLKISLKNWILFEFKKIIILDYSSSDGLGIFVKSLQPANPNLWYYRIEGEMKYNHSKARNIKMALCKKDDYVLSIDSDILLSNNFLDNISKIVIEKREVIKPVYAETYYGVCGTNLMTKDHYFLAGGCDEDMHGWGFEDYEMYIRMDKHFRSQSLQNNYLYHIEHSNELRAKDQVEKNIWQTNRENHSIGMKKGFSPSIYRNHFIQDILEVAPNGKERFLDQNSIWEGCIGVNPK